jgi:hypothetical protein
MNSTRPSAPKLLIYKKKKVEKSVDYSLQMNENIYIE